jgi:hypothetical protein
VTALHPVAHAALVEPSLERLLTALLSLAVIALWVVVLPLELVVG